MKEFQKDTPVVPFSNGTEAMIFSEMNCDRCINYENQSGSEEEAKCKLAFHLDYGTIIGSIPLWVAKEIGCEHNPLYGSVKLNTKCREFSDGTEPF